MPDRPRELPDRRPPAGEPPRRFDRRRFLAWTGSLGLGAAAAPGWLAAQEEAAAGGIGAESVACADSRAMIAIVLRTVSST